MRRSTVSIRELDGKISCTFPFSSFEELLRVSIPLAASWRLVSLFLEIRRARSTGYPANQKPGENSSGPALKNPNCCGRQYRSLRRVISSDCLLRYQKHDQQGARLLGSQEQSLGLSAKISNSAVVNNAQSFVASPLIVSTRRYEYRKVEQTVIAKSTPLRIPYQLQQYRLTILISSAATLPSEQELNNDSSRRYGDRKVEQAVVAKSTPCEFCTHRNNIV